MPGIQGWQAGLGDEQRRIAEAALIEHANMVEARLARRRGGGRARAPEMTVQQADVRAELEAREDADVQMEVESAEPEDDDDGEPIAQRHLSAMGIPPNQAEKLTQKDHAGRVGVAAYVSKNAAGEIARLKRRIEELKRRDARPVSAPVRIGDAVVTEDREANRVQIRFDGIPTKEMRSSLRVRGFVWAPSVGVWQRKLNDNASWAAKQVLRNHYGPNAVLRRCRRSRCASPATTERMTARRALQTSRNRRTRASRNPCHSDASLAILPHRPPCLPRSSSSSAALGRLPA